MAPGNSRPDLLPGIPPLRSDGRGKPVPIDYKEYRDHSEVFHVLNDVAANT
jgi:hypothetical protein